MRRQSSSKGTLSPARDEAQMAMLNRESRYFGFRLRSKNATRGTNSGREEASIGQTRRRLVDPFTQDGQISIERAIVEHRWQRHHLDHLPHLAPAARCVHALLSAAR